MASFSHTPRNGQRYNVFYAYGTRNAKTGSNDPIWRASRIKPNSSTLLNPTSRNTYLPLHHSLYPTPMAPLTIRYKRLLQYDTSGSLLTTSLIGSRTCPRCAIEAVPP